jgi:hypothetical protein
VRPSGLRASTYRRTCRHMPTLRRACGDLQQSVQVLARLSEWLIAHGRALEIVVGLVGVTFLLKGLEAL